MADMNIPANDSPAEQAHAVALPTRKDDLILPAFTASSLIPAIYIQQFWDTMCFNSSTGLYSYQLDEQWFNLHKNSFRDALDITPTNDNNPFVAPPLSDTVRLLDTTDQDILCCRFCEVKLLDTTDQDILCCRFCEVLFTALALTMLKGFGKSLFNPYKPFSLTGRILLRLLVGRKRPLICLSQALGMLERMVGESLLCRYLMLCLLMKLKEHPTTANARSMLLSINNIWMLNMARLQKEEQQSCLKLPRGTRKGKKKVVEEQDAHDLLTLQTPKNKSHVDQAGPNPGIQDEGQAGSNPGDAVGSQPQPNEEFSITNFPNVQENLKLPFEEQVIPKYSASSTGTLSSLQNLEKDLSLTYQFFVKKQQEEDPMKTNAEAEVQSMVSVLIHQDTSSVPLMTTPVIDLTLSQSSALLPISSATISTVMTTTTIPPPTPQPQQGDHEGQAYEVVKAFYPDVIHLQFQMEEYLEYLRHDSKGSSLALSISKMKAASYLDFGLEKFYIDRHDSSSRKKEVRSHMRVLSVVRIKAYSRYGDFEDLNQLLLQGHFDHLPGFDKRMLSTAVKLWTKDLVIQKWVEDFQVVVFPVNNTKRKIMRFNEIYKFSDGTLTWILEALAYRVKEFKIKQLNLGTNTCFKTQKYVSMIKEFITAIERRLKTRKIYWNLECFVGGRVRDIDYRLLQRTE
nr:hypothetical protein [Tanacetum cinerariifolium]